jgi:hypothetical protein
MHAGDVMGAADFKAEMARITLPALVIHGDKDVSAPLASEQ